jgi:hypothetical protein
VTPGVRARFEQRANDDRCDAGNREDDVSGQERGERADRAGGHRGDGHDQECLRDRVGAAEEEETRDAPAGPRYRVHSREAPSPFAIVDTGAGAVMEIPHQPGTRRRDEIHPGAPRQELTLRDLVPEHVSDRGDRDHVGQEDHPPLAEEDLDLLVANRVRAITGHS